MNWTGYCFIVRGTITFSSTKGSRYGGTGLKEIYVHPLGTLLGTPTRLRVQADTQTANRARAVRRIKSCRFRSRVSIHIRLGEDVSSVTLTVALLLVSDSLVWVFEKQLILWDFFTRSSLWSLRRTVREEKKKTRTVMWALLRRSGQSRTVRLARADSKAMETQRTDLYEHGEQKSIADGLKSQRLTIGKTYGTFTFYLLPTVVSDSGCEPNVLSCSCRPSTSSSCVISIFQFLN